MSDSSHPSPTQTSQENISAGEVWLLRQVLSQSALHAMREMVGHHDQPGRRIEESAPLYESKGIAALCKRIRTIWPKMRPVRMISFNKIADTNWAVPWHQDRVIAVHDRVDINGFKNWSRKDGVWHCEAPESVLARMLFVRLHLDDAAEADGAMEIALDSARHGRVSADNAEAIARSCQTTTPQCAAGDAIVLPMLTLHRSLASRSLRPRRVIRIDFADLEVPGDLNWRT
ncbi:phytanoyl-CoA dioxygenase family protein [Maricaulis sp. W15]|uniref:phytanoyl-CoA dioxygenase family protein n=1 Tax=Maricaulis sp. W15 TaxID=1772333 RepID=UPI0009F8E5C3|nr:phytanoyl-CoA dioxygenase family protein [Maricaulis sp. W15]